jgi:hypothetical protein
LILAFRPFWFETGTPTFLVDFLAQRQWFTPDLIQREADESLLSSFDVDKIAPEALLWQTGYLTTQSTQELFPGHRTYILSYPTALRQSIKALFASIPYEWYRKAQGVGEL